MKAITTKFIGPSNVRGSRYKATAEGGHSVTLSADHALNSEENHDRVAKALRDKMGWKGELVRGGLPDGKGNCYVFLHDYTRVKGSPHKRSMGRPPLPHQLPTSGYTNCACRDCFDTAIASDTRKPTLCSECKAAGCSAGKGECQRSNAHDSGSPTREPGWTTAVHLMTDWNTVACRKSPVHQKNIMRSREPEEVTCPKCMKYSPHLNWEWVKNTQADKAESRGNFPLARKLRAQAKQFAKHKARDGSPHHSHDASRLKRGDAVKGAPGTLHARLNGSVEWTRGTSVRVRWADGGTLTGPASAFVKISRKGSPHHSRHGKRELTIPERHALKVARDTLRMPDAMVGVMGGQNKETARRVIRELTGKEPEGSPHHHPRRASRPDALGSLVHKAVTKVARALKR